MWVPGSPGSRLTGTRRWLSGAADAAVVWRTAEPTLERSTFPRQTERAFCRTSHRSNAEHSHETDKWQNPGEFILAGVCHVPFRQLVTTETSPIPSAFTGSAICAASPTRTVTSRSTGNALTTAAVASTVPVEARRA